MTKSKLDIRIKNFEIFISGFLTSIKTMNDTKPYDCPAWFNHWKDGGDVDFVFSFKNDDVTVAAIPKNES